MNQFARQLANQSLAALDQLGYVEGRVASVVQVQCHDMTFHDRFLRDCAREWQFVVASFPYHGEPIIHGWSKFSDSAGEAQATAFANARFNAAPPDAELCRRTTDDTPTWRSRSGKLVILEHIRMPRSVFGNARKSINGAIV